MAQALQCPSCGGALDPDRRACPHCGVVTASRRCGVCFGLSFVQDRNCRSCGARLPREDSQARPERLPCPGCASVMTPRRLAQSSFDECDACGGLWLSPDASGRVTTDAEARAIFVVSAPPGKPGEPAGHAAPDARIVYRRCPVCDRMMNRSQYAAGSGVVLDQCKDHGSYYDRGELTRIFAFIESGGLEKARRRESEALRQDLRDLRRKAIASAGEGGLSGMRIDEPSGQWSGMDAMDLIRWIAGYFGGNKPENSG